MFACQDLKYLQNICCQKLPSSSKRHKNPFFDSTFACRSVDLRAESDVKSTPSFFRLHLQPQDAHNKAALLCSRSCDQKEKSSRASPRQAVGENTRVGATPTRTYIYFNISPHAVFFFSLSWILWSNFRGKFKVEAKSRQWPLSHSVTEADYQARYVTDTRGYTFKTKNKSFASRRESWRLLLEVLMESFCFGTDGAHDN